MAYKIVVNQEADEDIEQALDYYFFKVNPEVASRFYLDLQDAYDTLEINPFFEIRSKNYRALPLKKFPYLVFYELLESEQIVVVLALFHTSQDSINWPK